MALGTLAAIAGLVLTPVGNASFGFDPHGPVLTLVRVQKTAVKSCVAWADALVSVPASEMVPAAKGTQDALIQAWDPWNEKDLDAVQGCDDFPCQVKLAQPETQEMARTPKSERKSKYLALIMKRVEGYRETQARKAYEMPGVPVDPWKLFDERGLKSSLSRPESLEIFARKFNFAPDKMLTMHQVIDRRVARNSAGTEAVVWLRDAYTDHYFDSWGEFGFLQCDPVTLEATVVQAVLGEMDLLKKTNIFARAIFGQYRSAFEDNGRVYLTGQFERVRSIAQRLENQERLLPLPSVSPVTHSKK